MPGACPTILGVRNERRPLATSLMALGCPLRLRFAQVGALSFAGLGSARYAILARSPSTRATALARAIARLSLTQPSPIA